MRILHLPLLLLIISLITPLHAQWTQTSGPSGGVINALTAGEGMLLAGTDNGVFRSTDNGEHWTDLNFGTQYVSGALIHGKVLLVAAASGVYRSTDRGDSWTSLSVNGTLMVANARFLFLINSDRTIFRSADSGLTWTAINSLRQWGSSFRCATSNGSDLLVGGSGMILRSTDDGEGWTASSIYSPWVIAASGALAIAGGEGRSFISVDSGKSWTRNDLSESFYPAATILDGVFYLASYNALYRSIDSGHSWIRLQPDLTVSNWYVTGLVASRGVLFNITKGGGIHRSIDSGATWIPSSEGIVRSSNYAIIWHNGSMFAATSSGMHRSDDLGTTWRYSGLKDDIGALASDGEWIYAGTMPVLTDAGYLTGTYRSSDNGQTWEKASEGLTKNLVVSPLSVYALYVTNSGLLIGTNNGLFQSTDHAQSWNPIDTGSQWESQPIRAFAASDSILYAGAGGFSYQGDDIGGVFRSTDDGRSWQRTALRYDYPVSALAARNHILWAGLFGNDSTGLYRSSDQGATWSKFALPGGKKSGVIQALRYVNAVLFVATANGVFYTNDEGKSWKSYSYVLPPQTTIDTFLADETGIFAGTLGYGIWYRSRSDIASLGEALPSNSFTLDAIYPNPSSDHILISYSLPTSGRATLRLHDLQGKAISTLVDQEQTSGEHRLSASLENIPSGIYFITLQHGDRKESRQIVVMR